MSNQNNSPCSTPCGFGVCNAGCIKAHGIIPVKHYSLDELFELDRIFLPHLFDTCHVEVTPIVRPHWLQALWENAR